MCTVLILCLAPSENPYCKSHYEKGNKGFHSLIYSSCMKFCFLLWNSRAARDKKKNAGLEKLMTIILNTFSTCQHDVSDGLFRNMSVHVVCNANFPIPLPDRNI